MNLELFKIGYGRDKLGFVSAIAGRELKAKNGFLKVKIAGRERTVSEEMVIRANSVAASIFAQTFTENERRDILNGLEPGKETTLGAAIKAAKVTGPASGLESVKLSRTVIATLAEVSGVPYRFARDERSEEEFVGRYNDIAREYNSRYPDENFKTYKKAEMLNVEFEGRLRFDIDMISATEGSKLTKELIAQRDTAQGHMNKLM